MFKLQGSTSFSLGNLGRESTECGVVRLPHEGGIRTEHIHTSKNFQFSRLRAFTRGQAISNFQSISNVSVNQT